MKLAWWARLGEIRNYRLPEACEALVTGVSSLNILTPSTLSPILSLFPTAKVQKQANKKPAD